MTEIPQAISESVFTVLGVRLRCYVFDDGRRIIDADDLNKLVAVIEDDHDSITPDLSGVMRFLRWQSGDTSC